MKAKTQLFYFAIYSYELLEYFNTQKTPNSLTLTFNVSNFCPFFHISFHISEFHNSVHILAFEDIVINLFSFRRHDKCECSDTLFIILCLWRVFMLTMESKPCSMKRKIKCLKKVNWDHMNWWSICNCSRNLNSCIGWLRGWRINFKLKNKFLPPWRRNWQMHKMNVLNPRK